MDIATIAKKAEPIFRRNQVSYAGIFGSRARGDNRPDSDLDIVVRFKKDPTLFGLVGINNELTDALGVEVDLVMEDGMYPEIKKNALGDFKTIYGDQ